MASQHYHRNLESSAHVPHHRGRTNDDDTNSILVKPPKPAMSPNGALPLIIPKEYNTSDRPRNENSPLKTQRHVLQTSPSRRQHVLAKKVSFSSSQTTIKAPKPDMRYDDDEFVYVAHQLLNYLRWSDDSSSAADHGCQQTVITFHDAIASLYHAATGEKLNKPEPVPRPPDLTDEVMLDFQVALKFRLKYVSYQPSSKEEEVISLTREVSRALSMHGIPFIDKQSSTLPRRIEKEPEETRQDVDRDVSGKQTQATRHFFPEDEPQQQYDAPSETYQPSHTTPKEQEFRHPIIRQLSHALPQQQEFCHPIIPGEVPSESYHLGQIQPQQQANQQHPFYNEYYRDPTTQNFIPPHGSSTTFHTQSVNYTNEGSTRPSYNEMVEQAEQVCFQDSYSRAQVWHEDGVFEAVDDFFEPQFQQQEGVFEMSEVGGMVKGAVLEAMDRIDKPSNFIEVFVDENGYHPDHNVEIGVESPRNRLASMIPDRSFESETVVVREFHPSYSHQAPDRSFETETVVMKEFLNQGQPSQQIMDKWQESKQNMHQEIQRVTNMMHFTSNASVKTSCRHRLHKLCADLERLADLQTNRNDVSVGGFHVSVSSSALADEKATDFRSETPHDAQFTPEEVVMQKEMNILAPMDIPEDYKFQAQVDDHSFTATVPRGGVKKGELFQNATQIDVAEGTCSATTSPRMGNWHDGLFFCFQFGPLHPSVLNSIFCPILSLAQVMTRLKVGWVGIPVRQHRVNDTFRVALVLSMFVVIVNCNLYYLPHDEQLPKNVSSLQIILFAVFNALVLVYLYFNVIKTRRLLRQRYMIPEKSCIGFEDAALTIPCSGLVLMQMHRHTADYDTYSARCCSANGLPLHVHVNSPPVITEKSSREHLTEPLNA